MRTVAALYVETGGCYFGLPGVDPWDRARDARLYDGPYPVVAHPPCERWGRMWFGSPLKPDREKYRLGDDGGCFRAALAAVRAFGGVLEHPEASKAWDHFNLNRPSREGGWIAADLFGGWTCCVEQGHYGHRGRKLTWLYAFGCELPELKWGHSGQRLDPVLLERYGYLYARRCGITGMVGGKAKKKHRGATPEPFRDLLLSIARTAKAQTLARSIRPLDTSASKLAGVPSGACPSYDTMAHCEICDLWLEPWQSCLHLKPVDDGGNRRADRNGPASVRSFHSNACS